jgi:hypothetical protein
MYNGARLCYIQHMKTMKSRLVEDPNLDACVGSIVRDKVATHTAHGCVSSAMDR